MIGKLRSTLVLLLAAKVLVPAAVLAQKRGAEPPRFTDAERLRRLATAYPEVDARFQEFARKNHVPGIAWGIVVDGELAHSGAAGLREISSRAAVDADTVFRIASMTKSFTAMCILKLRDQGKLALDDPAESYLPELASLRYPTADSPRLTIRHLLSHAEGFPEDNPWGDRQLAVTDEQMSEMMRKGIPFSNAPGIAYEYSNYGFAMLGRIVARVSGVTYADYLKANILDPLGMGATTLEPGHVPSERLAHGYRWENDQWIEEPPLPDGAFGPMGGMLTSIRDLSRYVAFQLSAWPPRDDPESGPVRRSSLREMQQVSRTAPAVVRGNASSPRLNTGGYGYGLRISQTCAFRHVVAHSGGLPGFGSHMRWLPEHGVGIVAFGNLTYTSWGEVTDEAFEALRLTGGLVPREPIPSAALVEAKESVSRLVQQWDDGLADRLAAENLYLDRSKASRRSELEELRRRVGACRSEGPFEVENALRGRFRMPCERGSLSVSITLAPTMPPLVQYLDIRAMEPGETLSAAPTCEIQ